MTKLRENIAMLIVEKYVYNMLFGKVFKSRFIDFIIVCGL
jgi:hypothetical protein